MNWLGGIFEGTSHEFSGRQYNHRYEENITPFGTYSSFSWPEIEDFDRVAVSLADEGKRKPWINNSRLKEDENLARALHKSLNIESATGNQNVNRNGNMNHHVPLPYSTGVRICAGCNRVIGPGRVLSCLGAIWHPECFKCRACNLPITDHEYSLSGNYAYHKSCYKENYGLRCNVCLSFFRTNAAGLIKYKVHPFWADQKYCLFHDHDGTPRCCSCERMEPRGIQYVALNDGRKLCLECLDSAVLDTTDCQPLYHEIQHFFEGLDMKVDQKIPLLLVERQALNEAMDGESNGHHHMPETRGLCLSEEQTVPTVLRQPGIGIGNRVPNMRTELYKLTRHCEVTAILILCGLPRLLTGSILAHEMMHAFLRLKGYPTLRQDVEEGICQVLGHMWLTSQISSISSQGTAPLTMATSSRTGKRSPFEKKLAEFFKHQIESDMSQVYGNGFRVAHQAVLKYGLQKTLYTIRRTASFPY